jgi:hypothetical protein
MGECNQGMADIHPSDVIVSVVGYYSAELRRLQGLLVAQGEGAAELRKQLDELRKLHAEQVQKTRALLLERRQVQRVLRFSEDDQEGALLGALEKAATPP